MFLDYSGDVQLDLALILGRITHHVHPNIVELIKNKNIKFRDEFSQFVREFHTPTDAFLYEGSDCVFPGIRRPIISEQIGAWRNNICAEDGTILNDNTFPRHIWAYLATGRGYAGGRLGMWANSGLDKFELAHVFAHKKDERNTEREFFESFSELADPSGLFTSASNVVLIPKGFAKPTDHMPLIKACFFKRHFDLYGNNLIGTGLNGFKNEKVPKWYDKIKWLAPVLPCDWTDKVERLLEYRTSYLRKRYTRCRIIERIQ